MAYGEPHLINDIGMVGLYSFLKEEYYIDEEMISLAISQIGQFNIISPASGLKVGVIIKKETPLPDCPGHGLTVRFNQEVCLICPRALVP
jgi:hypothetical protein